MYEEYCFFLNYLLSQSRRSLLSINADLSSLPPFFACITNHFNSLSLTVRSCLAPRSFKLLICTRRKCENRVRLSLSQLGLTNSKVLKPSENSALYLS